MQTLHLTAQDTALAGSLLREGKLVIFPTETVYGLGANALDAAAARRIFEAKGRPSDNPLIAHIDDLAALPLLWREIPGIVYTLARAFWPGPLTMILPRTAAVPDVVTAGLDTVAVRFPAHPVARAIIHAAGFPIAAPSANLSGHPSPTTYAHVLHDMEGRVDAIVDGGDCGVGLESTVIAIETGDVRVLRPGGISPEMLASVLEDVEIVIDPGVTRPVEGVPRSPGMKYRHYAPLAPMTAYLGNPDATASRIRRDIEGVSNCAVLCYDEYRGLYPCPVVTYGSKDDPAALAHNLFDALRKLDACSAEVLYAQCPGDTGVELAVSNRLKRAAGFHLVTVEG
ncbi:MAG: L-threonylcarbamoyladenylate synthase [Clostridiaceae bacterium]|nr:L-threonylcarbamoyladenylate synthase [Clostridiaceae bacterium]